MSNSSSWTDDWTSDQFGYFQPLIKLIKSEVVVKMCPQKLSDRDEEIATVRSLRTRIEPNNEISQTVSRAAARLQERVDRHVETVENMFKSIDEEIGRRIQSASQGLDELLIVIDNSLASILENINSGNVMEFDLLRKSLVDVDDLINKRNQNINNFAHVTRELEKERTELIKSCYTQHMSDIKQLSSESFEWLFEKYLKNYNTIKLGNFRTYEDLRFKLVLLSGNLHRDFVLKAYDVKSSIKMKITESFKDKFRTAAETIISDNVSSVHTKSISIVNDSKEVIDNFIRQVEKQLDFVTISEGSESLKTQLKNIDEIVDSVFLLIHDKVSEDVQSLSTKTVEELDRTIKDFGESLSPNELTAIAEEMSNEAEILLPDMTETIADVKLLLSGVTDAIHVIDIVLEFLINSISGHLEPLTLSRETVLQALEVVSKSNDVELNMLVGSFDISFDSLVQASTQSEVKIFKNNCDSQLESIEDRIQINRTIEMNTIPSHNGLVESEFAKISEEIKTILKKFPKILKSIPDFNNLPLSEFWAKSLKLSITPFKDTVDHCQKTIYNRLVTLTSSDVFSDEFTWTTFLAKGIEERWVDATQLLELRAVKVNEGIVKKRTDEIEEHRIILERHIKASREISEDIDRETDGLCEVFDGQKKLILKKVGIIQSYINELSILELSGKIKVLRAQIESVANELNDQYKSHKNIAESGYKAIENSTSEFKKSIKSFVEGGNYGEEEAISTNNALTDLARTMFEKQTQVMMSLTRTNYGSIRDTKELLYKLIKPVEIELEKKILKKKYDAINRLMNRSVNQELLKLEKTIDGLHAKLRRVEKTFEKDDVTEQSKCWSEILLETQVFVDFFFESYRDLRALLNTQTNNSIWNSRTEKLKIIKNSVDTTFFRGESTFYDYCKTVVVESSNETDVGARFLNNIYLAIRQYVSESQHNAADIALTESTNAWLAERSDTKQVYREIMEDALKKSRDTVLQAECIWISKLSDFCDFLRDGLHVAERKFKNIVLATYHEESLEKLTLSFGSFGFETESTRKRLKAIRDKMHYKLKVAHGHPDNVHRLEALLDEFRDVRTECEDTLRDVCARAKAGVEKFAENYETGRPDDVMTATTMSVKCISNLRSRMDSVDTTTSISSVGIEYEAISKTLADRITEKNAVVQAVNNVKRYAMENRDGIVFWPDNTRLWADNLRDFLKICQDRFDDVQMFEAVENSKLVDWALMFVQDVEKVKKLHD